MSKKVDFAAGLRGLRAAPEPEPAREAVAPAPSKKGKTYIVPEARVGKVAISAYFEPAVRKQLAILAVKEEKTQAEMIAEALNLLFERYGESPIAKA